ncbi:MAG: macro domain-containing protein [Calditrichaeota bacterium]|nr:MAG: macro domain-containing protein [Calditrichota bacterium]
MENIAVNKSHISLVQGDITEQQTDAIVNAANNRLILGAGVAEAIRSKGGPAIQKECDALGGTPVGTAVITTAGTLPARFVIHAVGPMMGEGDEDAKLASATRSALRLAVESELKSITFPAISTGIFGFPIERCAQILVSEAKEFLQNDMRLEEVRFCLWDHQSYTVFREFLMG